MAIETVQRCTICGKEITGLGGCTGEEFTVQIPKGPWGPASEKTVCRSMTHLRADGNRWYRLKVEILKVLPAAPKA